MNDPFLNYLYTILCILMLYYCIYSIIDSNKRSKQMDETFNRLKAKWEKEDES
jgi:hypothetical protein